VPSSTVTCDNSSLAQWFASPDCGGSILAVKQAFQAFSLKLGSAYPALKLQIFKMICGTFATQGFFQAEN